jgi:phenylpropionate dioxygenase-like ring-hydroxylating dioxygenase large terminal subunit
VEHLGKATILLDRACEMSPPGRVRLTAGWSKQRFYANWKMLPEHDTDGYHVNSVHLSFVRAIRSQYDDNLTATEDKIAGLTRDWGHGHSEIDFGTTYKHPLQWMDTKPEKFPDYVKSMEEAYGKDKATELMTLGPPHAVIFPNLFFGEGNVVIFQPIDADTCVQWHTPLQLEGVSDAVNERLVRQSNAAMGPSAFLLADDAIIAERTQIALKGRRARLDLSRGLEREQRNGDVIVSHLTDETTNRSFWHHYRNVMSL